MRALHRHSPRRSSYRYQCNFSAAPGADVGTANHRPQQQLISSGRSPNGTFFLKRTIPGVSKAQSLPARSRSPTSEAQSDHRVRQS